uniref:Uncharacterized protein n=1 Tax=Tanacetum cinerariifolium TaxID=118510 RepID=A0A699H438_TANCI|nr:hypothetical protein [Tanacetum cinerariifolium]
MWGLKECPSCGTLYTKSCGCLKGGFIDKYVHDPNNTPNSSQRPPHDCPMFGSPVDGLYCRHCALLRKKLKEAWFTICDEHKFFQDFLNTSESSNDDSNVRCTCKSCGKGAHYGYNCLLKVLIISNLKQCHDQNVEEFPQTLPSSHPTCYSGDENSFTYDSTPNLVKDSPNVFNPHSQPLMYSYEFYEFIKSSVKNIIPNPSEYEDKRECDVPACDDFTTFSNLLFDADDDFSSSDDESFSDEDIPKEIYSNPIFDEEIISIKINPHHLNVESDLIESLLNQYSSIISSLKNDSLLDEFAGELILLKSIPPGIDEADCDPEEQNLSYREIVDSDPLRDESDLSLTLDDSMPPGIENGDYDSEGDILILEELLSNDSLSLPENESFHFDIPSSPRSPAKPPNDDEIEPNSRILTVKVVGDSSEYYVPIPRLLPTQPTHASNREKSPHLLSHQGLKAFQLSSESPMMIYGGNIPILDVPFLHF